MLLPRGRVAVKAVRKRQPALRVVVDRMAPEVGTHLDREGASVVRELYVGSLRADRAANRSARRSLRIVHVRHGIRAASRLQGSSDSSYAKAVSSCMRACITKARRPNDRALSGGPHAAPDMMSRSPARAPTLG